MPFTVLILGGYGFFGQRLAKRLAADATLHIVLAGRNLTAAQSLVDRLQTSDGARMSAALVDATDRELSATLRRIAAHVVVHTGGPYQGQGYHVAEACIAASAHYLDLADARDFVTGIGVLDARAKEHDVLVLTGASTLPALSSAVVDEISKGLRRVDAIDIGISPGNRTDRGLATVRAILSYCGVPIRAWHDTRTQTVYGWLGLKRYRYPAPVGTRWLSYCDVPDLELFPARYPGLKTIDFRAGLELPLLHLGMSAMALCKRLGLVRDWSRYALPLKKLSDSLRRFGSDAGAMHVEVRGEDLTGASVQRTWILVARNDDGPTVPTLASTALIHKLARGQIAVRGAMPCVGLLELSDFVAQMGGLAIDIAEFENGMQVEVDGSAGTVRRV
jgi:saccharopine dehydrogenase-like NADP-dependent oxidoreductase